MNDQPDPPVRIFLRPLGSPLTIGLSGLAVASLVVSGLDLSWISSSEQHQVGYIIMAVPFVLQLIACLFAYLSRDGAAGAALGVMSVTWFAYGLIDATSAPGSRSGALGLLLLACSGVLFLSSLAVAIPKPLPGTVFGLAAVRFTLTGIYLLGAGQSWRHAAAIIGLVICGIAGYGVLAFELEGERRRPVLPTFRRGPGPEALQAGGGREAMRAEPSLQDRGILREPGVRQTT